MYSKTLVVTTLQPKMCVFLRQTVFIEGVLGRKIVASNKTRGQITRLIKAGDLATPELVPLELYRGA